MCVCDVFGVCVVCLCVCVWCVCDVFGVCVMCVCDVYGVCVCGVLVCVWLFNDNRQAGRHDEANSRLPKFC